MRGGGRSSGGRGRGKGRNTRNLSPRRYRAPRCSLSPPSHRQQRPSHGNASPVQGRAHLTDQDYDLRGKRLHHGHVEEQENFHHKYMLPDHSTNLTSNVSPNLQLNRSAKDEDFMAPSRINDGISRTYSLNQENLARPVDPHIMNPLGSMRSNLGVGTHHYHEQTRNPHDELERDKGYPKDTLFFDMMPPVQPRPLVGGSLKDDSYLGFHDDRDGVGKYADDPLKYNEYRQEQPSEPLKRGLLNPWAREDQLGYGYDELGRGRDVPPFIGLESTNREVPWRSRSEYRNVLGSSLSELGEERVDASRKNVDEGSFWNPSPSLHGGSAMDFHDLNGSRSGYVAHMMESSRDRAVAPSEEGYSFGRDVVPMAYRQGERSSSPLFVGHHRDVFRYGVSPPVGNPRLDGRTSTPLLVDHHMDMVRHRLSPPQGNSRFDNDLDMYNLSPERMDRRKYVMNHHGNVLDSRDMLSNDRNIHRRVRMQSPILGGEMWSTEEDMHVLPSSREGAYGHYQYRMPSHRFSRKDQAPSEGSYACAKKDGHVMSSKKRLRPYPSEFHGSLASQGRQVLPKPYKFWKTGPNGRHVDLNAPDGDERIGCANNSKIDPPENSMEFKQQVHKSFLRFSKLLNKSQHEKKRYRDDQGRSSNLLCRVCGSVSKEFVDTHSLLSHTYHSLKRGLRTEHLGFHKALCVLMGWNWQVPADTSKSYVTRCDTEVKALEEDLILWPPLVIINNSSIGNRNSANAPKVVSIEGMEEILKGMGFGLGKCKICGGKPENQSVLLLKFPATFSGLQEAERLHKYYADKKRGREEFQKITSSNGSTREAPAVKDAELLYGYMAIAEDLDKLDPETKKRCHVKSRKDIEAIADAPLDAD